MNGDVDQVEKVNRAFARQPSPSVGQPGSTPETDLTNLAVARSMERSDLGSRFGFGSPQYLQARTPTDELIEGAVQGREASGPQPTMQTQNEEAMHNALLDGISSRRDELEGYRRQIMAKLGIIPPGEAGYAAVTLASGQRHGHRGEIPSDREMLLENLSVLNKESDDLLREHHYAASEFARRAHENLWLTKDAMHARDAASLHDDIHDIIQDSNLEPGTPEYEAAIMQAVENNELGANTPAGQHTLAQIARENDQARARKERFAQTPEKTTARYARILGDVAAGTKGAKEEKDALEKLHPELKSIAPPEATPAPKKPGVLQRIGSFFSGGSVPAATQTTATAPIDARIALAQKALADPNATEDHKKAARKILGLPDAQ